MTKGVKKKKDEMGCVCVKVVKTRGWTKTAGCNPLETFDNFENNVNVRTIFREI